MYQSFIAPLTCSACGLVSPEDESTTMQTECLPWEGEPPLTIRVGDSFLGGFQVLLTSGFRELRRPRDGEPTRLLTDWECPHCGTARQWALIEIIQQGTRSRVNSIEPVPKNEATLRSAHALSHSLVNAYTLARDDFVDVIVDALREAT